VFDGVFGLDADNIRIPFEKIAVDQNRYVDRGNMDVTVTTPK